MIRCLAWFHRENTKTKHLKIVIYFMTSCLRPSSPLQEVCHAEAPLALFNFTVKSSRVRVAWEELQTRGFAIGYRFGF